MPRLGLLKGAWSHLALVQYGHPSLKSTGLKSTHTGLPQTLGVPQWAPGKVDTSLTVLHHPHLPGCFLWQRLHCGPCTMVWGSWAPTSLSALSGPCSQSLPDVFTLLLSRISTHRAGKVRSCVASWSCHPAAIFSAEQTRGEEWGPTRGTEPPPSPSLAQDFPPG